MMTHMEDLTTRHASWITPVFFALSFYFFGSAMMDYFIVYHSWQFVGEAEFVSLHKAAGGRGVFIFVIPSFVVTIFNVLLFWHRPKSVSKKLVVIALICLLISWVSSALIQIPIQLELDNGKNNVLLEELFATNWIRIIPTGIYALVVFVMLKKSIS
jgi:hypothetical protein